MVAGERSGERRGAKYRRLGATTMMLVPTRSRARLTAPSSELFGTDVNAAADGPSRCSGGDATRRRGPLEDAFAYRVFAPRPVCSRHLRGTVTTTRVEEEKEFRRRVGPNVKRSPDHLSKETATTTTALPLVYALRASHKAERDGEAKLEIATGVDRSFIRFTRNYREIHPGQRLPPGDACRFTAVHAVARQSLCIPLTADPDEATTTIIASEDGDDDSCFDDPR